MDLIVAVDLKWGIGKKNDLLFHIPEDMRFFRSKTLEKTVILGKNTLLSFPESKPLPKRHHLLLTHSEDQFGPEVTNIKSLDELEEYIRTIPSDDLVVIGGASVYAQLYKKCKYAFVTKVSAVDTACDTFFPNLDSDPDFRLVEQSDWMLSEKAGLKYSFCKYENIALL